VSLERQVEIIGDDGRKYSSTATVWTKGGLDLDSVEKVPSSIRDAINEEMTAFAAEYYKQNP
jgi:hypothetical protein